MPSSLVSCSEYQSPYRIILGVDYGTTFSGAAYVTSNKTADDIVIVSEKWPGRAGVHWKGPSIIAYAMENRQKITQDKWGFEVTPTLKQYVWTKLLLDQHVDVQDHDDPLLREMYGNGFLSLPAGKSAKDVAQDFLKELHAFVVRTLKEHMGAQVYESMAIECWITVPAIWSHTAEADTRNAAIAAGFGARPGDIVNVVKEPEAAALSALKPHLGYNAVDPLKIGEHVLIVDCGGGTVDLITYEILKVNPRLEHKEKARGSGAKCGATAIDRRFVEWMTRQFGTAYTSLDIKKRGPGSNFMRNFEVVKRNFGDRDHDRDTFEVEPIDLELPAFSLKYDEDERAVKLSRQDMMGLFDGPVSDIVRVVEEQETQLRARGCRIDRFILVGGFGDSQYLHRRLQEWCTRKGVRRFTSPPHCQAAIVKGAVLRGLEGIRPTTTIARRHYGWSRGEPFRKGIDDEFNSYIEKWNKKKYCRGRMRWAVEKDQEMDETFHVSRGLERATTDTEVTMSVPLYSCTLDPAPERQDDFGVHSEGTIKVTIKADDLSSSQLESRWDRSSGRTLYRYVVDIQVNFRSQSGILTVKVFAYGREAGTANISFHG